MKFLFQLPLVFALSGCQPNQETGVTIVNAAQVKQLLEEEVTVIDVRTPQEYDNGRIKGALLINFLGKDFEEEVIKLDKSKPLLIYCGVGGRSKKACEQMLKVGFERLYDYQGGFSDWSSKGEEIER
ncbi:MAG: rhodanese-like domain-containing protein [Bacteroidota bacterium]